MKVNIQTTAMRRAWEIFRQIYNYPRISFSRIDHPCFASTLRLAAGKGGEAPALITT